LALYDDLGYARWVRRGGGSGFDQGKSVAVDGAGNIYVAGIFNATASFQTGMSVTSAGYNDLFVVKYDTLGSVRWVKRMGGNGFENNPSLVISRNGNLFLTGNFSGKANFGTDTLTSAGSDDVFVARMDTAGNFMWVRKAGGPNSDLSGGIAVDNADNVYLTGRFTNTAAFGTNNLISAGSADIFVAKYNATGAIQWANRFGGSGLDAGNALVADGAGNTYLTGSFENNFAVGTTTITSSGSSDVFVIKLNTSGAPQWARTAGSTVSDAGRALALDAISSVYVTGVYQGKIGFGTDSLTSAGADDIFIAKYSSSGNRQWIKRTGGTMNESALALTVDKTNNIYLTGFFQNKVGFNPDTLTSVSNSEDIFIGRISANPLPVAVPADITTTQNWLIYPNPFTESIALRNNTGQSGRLTVYNLTGAVIRDIPVSSAPETEIWLNGLGNGVYMFVVTYGSQREVFKVLKQ
ncbi:MAG: SBBP repeat-containing protein, partial [Hymenobacteraceae bacterium]|nr:SBBP repeat-containing protein [Hymenobacteraceae bacterium]MDX5395866.1 SBBP repeat-containing protein [Hymenobacteraceae bacterium]MDX5511921.1 SBBP repeat-containing protein [Hymenobacteraceae bacterium]